MSEATDLILKSKVSAPGCAIAYGRASTSKQEQSIAGQREQLTHYAVGCGLILDEENTILDDDVSGGTPFAQRPGGAKVLRQFSNGHSQHLIVPTIDRLGRNALDVQNTIGTIHQLGGTVHILNLGGSNFNTRSPVSGLIIAVLAWAAEMELARIRERVRSGIEQKRRNGELCGNISYGWDAVPTGEIRINKGGKEVQIKRLEDNPEEQEWILHMEGCRREGMSDDAIAADLNRRHVKTKRSGEQHTVRCASDAPGARQDRRGSGWVRDAMVFGLWRGKQVATILNSKTVRDWLACRE